MKSARGTERARARASVRACERERAREGCQRAREREERRGGGGRDGRGGASRRGLGEGGWREIDLALMRLAARLSVSAAPDSSVTPVAPENPTPMSLNYTE